MKLKFGTGGLRAVMGPEDDQMNVFAIQEATLGVAAYGKAFEKMPRVAIAYDTRNNSECFAKETARVLALEGCKAFIYPAAMPTPMLSYAVRELQCLIGVCLTASHNPREYNGYKVYGADGCQITNEAAKGIAQQIAAADRRKLEGARSFEELVQEGKIEYISEELRKVFLNDICKLRTRKDSLKDLKVVYTPLHGTGLVPITEMFQMIGAENVTLVEEQITPDGNFPTCPFPNPEEESAMRAGLFLCEQTGADILLATDPDSDRLGVAAKHGDVYETLNGNQLGVLILDYILRHHKEAGTMPERPIVLKTIVTTTMAEKIAKSYGAEMIETLTGFKYIGEQIGELEKKGELSRFVFGLEESCGYLIGPYVRDKDAVGTVMIVCEMADAYKKEGKTLWDVMEALYQQYGNYQTELETKKFKEEEAIAEMQNLRDSLQSDEKAFYAGTAVVRYEDYREGLRGLPKSNVIKLWLEDESTVVIRPSGTEPKIKIYKEKCQK